MTEADVVVVGSGGAGLTAALAAATQGARVVVLEKTTSLGGTTAMSGGTMWIPANHLAATAGLVDTADEALEYLIDGGGETANRALLRAFVAEAPRMLAFLEQQVPGGFYLARDGDYHAERPGAKTQGRSVLPRPFEPGLLGSLAASIRAVDMPLDVAEAYGSLNPPQDAPGGSVDTDATKRWTRGRALVATLAAGCQARGVRFVTGHRAQRLLTEKQRVTGVAAEAPHGPARYDATRAVVLASGGFEWDSGLVADFLPAPLEAPAGLPSLEGDGLRMAMVLGAGLGSMAEAWWSPTIRIPGETYEGRPYARMVVSQRLYPHSIVVNRAGRRFTNEAQSYHDFGGTLMAVDHGRAGCLNRPAWLLFDSTYRRRYGLACVSPDEPDPEWLVPFQTLGELARDQGIDPDALVVTVRLFNAHAAAGRDPEFGRGTNQYSLWKGDRSHEGVRRTLGPLDSPPFYAVPMHAGVIGTRGGPRTDTEGRVLDVWGGPIPGLFAAGNVAASPSGLLYPGAGGTLGLALTFGYVAGRAAARAPSTTRP